MHTIPAWLCWQLPRLYLCKESPCLTCTPYFLASSYKVVEQQHTLCWVCAAGSDIDFALAGWVMTPEDRQLELHEWTNLEQQHVVSAQHRHMLQDSGRVGLAPSNLGCIHELRIFFLVVWVQNTLSLMLSTSASAQILAALGR
jgi:hypothetical protein